MTSDEKPETMNPETEGPEDLVICTQGWEALRGDTLGWLLDERRPNLQWRVLVELVGRPADSPAVRRARGGANAVEPVAGLLGELLPDGRWATDVPLWEPGAGPGWRLLASVQMGADPEDPRLHAASEVVLETAPGDGGLAGSQGSDPDSRLTARALEAMVTLGWGKHARVQEWLAWFEATPEWEDDPVVSVAVLAASGGGVRPVLVARAVDGLGGVLAGEPAELTLLDHPNLLSTDLAEIFSRLASAGIEWRPEWRPALEELQRIQGERGRWGRTSAIPVSLGIPTTDDQSGWITLAATNALLTYAVDAGLPRFFPRPPDQTD